LCLEWKTNLDWQIDIPQRVVIVGGQAAGCKTAARLARLLPECDIKIIERSDIISFGSCGLPFYAAGEIDDVIDLAKTPWGVVRDADYFKNAKGVEVLTSTEVVEINHDDKSLKCSDLKNGNHFKLSYDALVLTTGSKPKTPLFSCPKSERINNFLRPKDAQKFRQMAQTGKIGSAIILGGGFIGVELAEALVSLWGIETTIIEKENRLLPQMLDEIISKKLSSVLQKNEITLHLNSSVTKIESDDEENPSVFLDNGDILKADYIFICLGLIPETTLAKSLKLEHGPNGGILVDDQMQTSIPGILAAGDCVEITNLVSEQANWFPLGSLANKQGRVVAESMAHHPTKFAGAVGTTSVKVFDFIVANTGLTSAQAKHSNIDYKTVWATFLDRPDYHPERKNLFVSMIYESKTMRILGFQAAGAGEVTRYVDVVSALLPKQVTALDLIELEHAYTPPHASPLSPLNHLGAMIIAQKEDNVKSISPELSKIANDILLDVRTDDEFQDSPIEFDAIHVPQDQLRQRKGELDSSNPIHVICRRGPRSFEAVRFLKNQGVENVDYIGGGTAMMTTEEDDEE